MRKIIFISTLLFLGSCVETSTNPDGQIVVIGNGADGVSNWSDTIVADSKLENISKSYILDGNKAIAAPQLVSWVKPDLSGEEALVKFQEPKSDKIPCAIMKAVKFDFKCDNQLDSLSLSDDFLPLFLKNGETLFVDSTNSLYLKAVNAGPVLIGQNILDFFIDSDENIYWKNNSKFWTISKLGRPENLLSTGWVASSSLVYVSGDDQIFVYTNDPFDVQTASGLIKLSGDSFYQYHPGTNKYELIWKKEDRGLHLLSEYNRKNVQNGSLLVRGMRPADSANPKRIILLDSRGIFEIPVDPKYLGEGLLQVGPENIYVPVPKDTDSSFIGTLCSSQKVIVVSAEAQKPAFDCKLLKLPDGRQFIDATLARDNLVISLNREDSKGLPIHEVYALNSEVDSFKLGQIQKTWRFDNDITALRYFGLEFVSGKDRSAEVRNSDFRSNEKVVPNGSLADK